ncbi:MAG: hypothetical protein ABWZ91_15070 [Nocardioides sp.]|jgi:hypothetical protein
MDLTRLTVPQRLSVGAALVTVIAAFLPWVSIFGISALGIEGDGVITLILALAGAVILLLTAGVFSAEAKTPAKAVNITLIVLASLVTLIGLVDMNGAAAIGLYLTLFAGMAWLAGAIWHLATATKVAPSTRGSGVV